MTAERKQAEEYLRDNKISGCDFIYATGFRNMVELLERFASLRVAEATKDEDDLLTASQKILTWIKAHPRKATIVQHVIDEFEAAITNISKK